MKPIDKLLNGDKGRLLHQLFPAEMPGLIQFIKGMCLTLNEEEEKFRATWNNGLFSFDFWLFLCNEAAHKIDKYGTGLSKSGKVFADQLFDGHVGLFTVYCLTEYTQTIQQPNRKFSLAVDLLFNP